MKNSTLLLLASTLTFLLYSCGSKEAPSSEIKAIEKVIQDQHHALVAGDSTKIKKLSYGSEQEWAITSAKMAGDSDQISADFLSMKITEYKDTKAVVEVVLQVPSNEGQATMLKSIRTVTKENGAWLVSSISEIFSGPLAK